MQLRADTANSTNPTGVSFISVDPDILQFREIMTAVPLSMAVEQLFTDSDMAGQIHALKRLAQMPPHGEY
jgi:hypothetical protein